MQGEKFVWVILWNAEFTLKVQGELRHIFDTREKAMSYCIAKSTKYKCVIDQTSDRVLAPHGIYTIHKLKVE